MRRYANKFWQSSSSHKFVFFFSFCDFYLPVFSEYSKYSSFKQIGKRVREPLVSRIVKYVGICVLPFLELESWILWVRRNPVLVKNFASFLKDLHYWCVSFFVPIGKTSYCKKVSNLHKIFVEVTDFNENNISMVQNRFQLQKNCFTFSPLL